MKKQAFFTPAEIAPDNEKSPGQKVSGSVYRHPAQERKAFFMILTGIVLLFNSCQSVIVDPSDDRKPFENVISMPLKYDNSQVVQGLKDSSSIVITTRK
ncbi:hypothetical protein SAMN04515674_106140 [Pseudarcicella hirudinis]|uniref:Uncharacterized protein n=1 Tax=Pseudarcicella hirudinis TaxID=1079859 RepID=A0A1I5TPM8_9BACT|nr:hypothetical protein [Pseudarcicella hirudinis]SFP84938.1 hypothetical protein SAMN04515674_106140 [Pseudarcicella hirudinis]